MQNRPAQQRAGAFSFDSISKVTHAINVRREIPFLVYVLLEVRGFPNPPLLFLFLAVATPPLSPSSLSSICGFPELVNCFTRFLGERERGGEQSALLLWREERSLLCFFVAYVEYFWTAGVSQNFVVRGPETTFQLLLSVLRLRHFSAYGEQLLVASSSLDERRREKEREPLRSESVLVTLVDKEREDGV